jgi:hypothetical protein
MKITAYWDIAPCNLEVHRRFRSVHCIHHQGPSRRRNLKSQLFCLLKSLTCREFRRFAGQQYTLMHVENYSFCQTHYSSYLWSGDNQKHLSLSAIIMNVTQCVM